MIVYFFVLIKFTTFQNFFIFRGVLQKIKIPKIFILQSNLRQTVFVFTLQNNYSHTHRTFIFYPIGFCNIFHEIIGASFLFLLQKHFYIAHENIGAFCFFLLQKDFATFHEHFWKAFFFFHNILLTVLNVGKRIINNDFISFFICCQN